MFEPCLGGSHEVDGGKRGGGGGWERVGEGPVVDNSAVDSAIIIQLIGFHGSLVCLMWGFLRVM